MLSVSASLCRYKYCKLGYGLGERAGLSYFGIALC